MLLDWFHYLTTPADPDARRLGFVRDSVWLRSRARRCRQAWRPHLDLSRQVIGGTVAAMGRRRTAIVLGSGLLDDVPLATLAEAFEALILVDIVHPRPTRRAIRRYPHVSLVAFDLSGASDWMLGRAVDLGPVLPACCMNPEVDLVISANVLSQLPILPLDWFEARGVVAADLGSRIVCAHLDALAGLGARICLLSDIAQVEQDGAGRVLDRSDLLHGVPLGVPDQEWDWTLAPFGEAARGSRLIHRVHAFRDWRPPA